MDWTFLTETLHSIGLAQRMMHWVQAIYSCPSTQVKVNGHLSRPFEITNSTCQGCPLSPLIFILTLEPFLQTIQNNPDISGLHLDNTLSPKIAAFADDLLFFISNPLISIPNLLSELKAYEMLSGF